MNRATVNPAVAATAPGQKPDIIDAPELADDIVAKPLVGGEFTEPIKLKNPNAIARWIEFKARDGYRFHQCEAQGFVVVKAVDLAEPAKFAVYSREAGTKFLNGDLILMMVDRKRYLGAIKHRVEQAMYTTNPEVRQAIAKRAAQAGMPSNSRGVEFFAPGAADIEGTGIQVNKIPGIAGTPGVEQATGNDIRAGKTS